MSLAAWSVPRRGFSGVAPSWNSRRSFCRALYTVVCRMCVAGSVPRETFNPEPPLTGVAPAVGGFHFWNKLPGTRLGEVARVLPPRMPKKLFTSSDFRLPSQSGARTAPPGLGYTYLIRAGRSNAIPSA
ncbi:hypothetical protein VFPFJ_04269 [Purpureocillium lilacinum]|uniref:Uncharacterized protein n=1 Tax=Purpureocillium lilacinum TaxID=33203 RepID=A0A179HSI1_PURLI|nr:hypothetical protein VFPFJ_04269 [Purpureocillium lilacinum]OAQ92528.1 hypothetical protein VFPFJ_04269 [Purpureocillium lilacinum]